MWNTSSAYILHSMSSGFSSFVDKYGLNLNTSVCLTNSVLTTRLDLDLTSRVMSDVYGPRLW